MPFQYHGVLCKQIEMDLITYWYACFESLEDTTRSIVLPKNFKFATGL